MFLQEELKIVHILTSKIYINEQKANTLSKAAEMADKYFLSHKHLPQKGSPHQTFQRTFHSNKNRCGVSSSSTKTTDSKLILSPHFRSIYVPQVNITFQHVSIAEKRSCHF